MSDIDSRTGHMETRSQSRSRSNTGREITETFFEFRILREACGETGKKNKKTIFSEIDISKPRVNALFKKLRGKLGVTELCKEYRKYHHWNMELTVLPDGSSFCHQVKTLPCATPDELPFGVFCTRSTKTKVSNDLFPPRYTYDTIMDIIDVIFPWVGNEDKGDQEAKESTVDIVMSARYEVSSITGSHQKAKKSVRQMGIVDLPGESWCEIMVRGPENSKELFEATQFVMNALQKKKKKVKKEE